MISILLPFKNEQRYIEETISSILKQTETGFEILAINDHSTDESVHIVKSLAEKDSRIHLLDNKGQGVIEALKTGYQKSSGKFITRQDGDDLMPINKLEILKKNLIENGIGSISTGKVSYFSEQELGEGFKKYEAWLNFLCDKNTHWDEIYKECVIASSNWLMYKEDFKKLDYFSDIIYPEDYYLVFKLFEKKFNVITANQVTHLWRDHPQRASRISELYQNQNFFPLKVKFFLQFHHPEDLIIWGAGPNGKELMREFQTQKVTPRWITTNEKKIGKSIYDVKIEGPDSFQFSPKQKLIICTRQPQAVQDIRSYLKNSRSPQIFEF